MNNPDKEQLPLGLGMAMAQNTEAMRFFAGLNEDARHEIISRTHGISSKAEMKAFVDNMKNETLY